MAIVVDALSWAAIVAGGLLLIIGAVGILRFPDVYARMHAAGIIDTLGAGLLMLGLAFQAGFSLIAVKLFLILGFIFFTSPTTTHALARAAMEDGVKPITVDDAKDGAPSNN